MVFKHNKQPFGHDESCQIGYKHSRQLDCGGQLASFTELSSFSSFPEGQLISDGERDRIFSQSSGSRRRWCDDDNASSAITLKDSEDKAADASRCSWIARCSTEAVRSEHCKRSFNDEFSCQAIVKRTRQADKNSHSADFASSSNNTSGGPPIPVPACVELEHREGTAVSMDISRFSCSAIEEGTRLHPPVRLSFFPGYFEDSHRTNQPDEIYSPNFEYPRKHVPIGSNHQADVPVWRSNSSDGEHLIDGDNSSRWMGTLVMLMPNPNPPASDIREVSSRTGCSCRDEGSIRCTREHVTEAREELERSLGPERFKELGFCDMGEDVAQRWTQEEEQLFLDVVVSNPASSGKNFWDELPKFFPSWATKDLVSYYFNVFVLRKRADQNRFDPSNPDSDDDEWQNSDGCEFVMTEDDDEDSVIESPVDPQDDDDDHTIFEKPKYVTDPRPQNGSSDDLDAHDDSCTSYEAQHSRVVDPIGFTQTWETGYILGIDRGVDFSPTCDVIEEVLGDL